MSSENARPQLRNSGALMLWAVGAGKPLGIEPPANTSGGSAIVVAENAQTLRQAWQNGVVTNESRVFVRNDVAQELQQTNASSLEGAVPFDGRFDLIGTEVRIGESFRLQVQSYAVSEFLTIAGPTLIRIMDSDDLSTLVADMASTAADGVFPDFLTNPVVQLADVPGLSGDGKDQSGPLNRLWLGEDGTISTTPSGAPLATDGMSEANEITGAAGLDAQWRALNADSPDRDAVALAKAVPAAERAELIENPDELRNFLVAASAVRSLRARGKQHIRISGYGTRINNALTAEAGASTVVSVAVSGDEHFLVDTTTGRTFGVTAAVASAADALLACDSLDAAAEFSPREHLTAVSEMLDRAGISR